MAENNECISSDYQRLEKGHGRLQSRRARVLKVSKELKSTCSEWKVVKCITEIKRTRQELIQKTKRDKDATVDTQYASTEIFTAGMFLNI